MKPQPELEKNRLVPSLLSELNNDTVWNNAIKVNFGKIPKTYAHVDIYHKPKAYFYETQL